MTKVKFEEVGRGAILTLDRPAQLCALDLEMVQELQRTLMGIDANKKIDLVLLRSSVAKAFCAGGDVKRVVQEMLANNFEYGELFFELEYTVDEMLHRLSAQTIAICQGITMGGGLGLAMATRFRIATPTTRIAMPELAIGFYPDVGATYFLNQLRPGYGLFLAMSGITLTGYETVAFGLTDVLVSDGDIASCQRNLVEHGFVEFSSIQETFAIDCSKEIEAFRSTLDTIEADFATSDFAGCLAAFDRYNCSENPFLKRSSASFASGSPLSIRLVFEQLRRGATLDLSEAFTFDKIFAKNMMTGSDFVEGVRAKLIDKSGTPSWKFRHVNEISVAVIESFFEGTSLRK